MTAGDDALAAATRPLADAAAVEREVALACAARATAAAVPTGRRAEILHAVAATLRAEAAAFAAEIVAEVDKPLDLALGEAARAAATFEAAAAAVGAARGAIVPLDVAPGHPAREALVRRVPAGVVFAITPFNFPLNLVAHKVAPAIAAGCPLLLKPAPAAPRTAARLVAAVRAAGWPADALRLLPLAEDSLAAPILADPRVRVFTFTGSAAVGWKLRDLAAGKVVGLELGGDAFAIVHADADVGHAARRVAFGAFAYAGQTCISVQHVLVHRSRAEEFLAAFAAAAAEFPCGDPRRAGVLCGPVLRDRDAERIEAWIDDAVRRGARAHRPRERRGRFVSPQILTGLPPEAILYGEEAFGPVADVAFYDDPAEIVARVDASRYGLQAGVFTSDLRLVRRLFAELDVGGLVVDDVPTLRIDAMPYGGRKASGLLREGPAYALEWMTEPKTLVW